MIGVEELRVPGEEGTRSQTAPALNPSGFGPFIEEGEEGFLILGIGPLTIFIRAFLNEYFHRQNCAR